MTFVDTAIGIYHFLGDRTPRNIPLVTPRPRSVNPWRVDGKVLVSKVRTGPDIRVSIQRSLALLGGLDKAIQRGDRVLVKPNFNSPDPPPASTDLEFLQAVVGLLQDVGAKVTIGESSGGIWRPTRNVLRKLGVPELARGLGVELIIFEDRADDWLRIKIDGDYLRSVAMPRSAYEADKLVYLPCMKTHGLARFSGALKLAFGFVHPGDRRAFHMRFLERKLAEVSLCWLPNLIVMDGRKAFVSGGPEKGQVVEPGLILASGDLIATDVEAMKIILVHNAKNRLTANPWALPQIVVGLQHGLGAAEDGYAVIE